MNELSNHPRTVKLLRWGYRDYAPSWDEQEMLFKRVEEGKLLRRNGQTDQYPLNYLITVEHPPVYTLGKSANAANLIYPDQFYLERGAQLFKINRGGDVTFHGPGQLVVYPIFDLDQFFTDIHKYLRFLEEAVIRTLAEYGIMADRSPGETGVWIDPKGLQPRKICAMGVRAARWITMHGLALNVNTDLRWFDYIIPCGIRNKAVTSIKEELNREISLNEVEEKLLRHFQELFDFHWQG
ncbi:octanoyltransferase [Thermaurantimonas aggregans]|uniref:Octanoyltransferase n=1 Tax=Thermaurantimonas aggregans TaxID=2173829 RepID=A0A401XHR4_9FLAO|nr:lipoyl(octanoyl) transferase LipB [Thermaurantimonas aggregans]MCX8149464.1 lipoyl(octanoyl) transferase LipB [Thermaurantimonas aggregans]GCD76549.1 octanoyltransferase [Thermaurantimonas aggregans]